MNTLPSAGQAHAVLREAVRWRLLGMLFERPRAGWHAEIQELGAGLDDERLQAAIAAAGDAGEGAYQAVFGPGAPVSPREVGYRRREDPGTILAELKAFHTSFAFTPRAEDPVDHVAVEVGFAGYLRLKEAYALARGDHDAAAICHAAFERFRERHLRFLAEPLAVVLEGSPVPHAALAAQILFEAVGAAPDDLNPVVEDGDGAEFGCAGGVCPAVDPLEA